jgi:hypothetical protein
MYPEADALLLFGGWQDDWIASSKF